LLKRADSTCTHERLDGTKPLTIDQDRTVSDEGVAQKAESDQENLHDVPPLRAQYGKCREIDRDWDRCLRSWSWMGNGGGRDGFGCAGVDVAREI